tara:strand:- start:427 stop:654 length:228 start_codon:yes stop_codon:yes gene_type:complete
MISTLCKSLPDGSFLVFAKHYRDNSNKVKFIANFSHCADMNLAINNWLMHSLSNALWNVEYSRIRESEVTVIISF